MENQFVHGQRNGKFLCLLFGEPCEILSLFTSKCVHFTRDGITCPSCLESVKRIKEKTPKLFPGYKIRVPHAPPKKPTKKKRIKKVKTPLRKICAKKPQVPVFIKTKDLVTEKSVVLPSTCVEVDSVEDKKYYFGILVSVK